MIRGNAKPTEVYKWKKLKGAKERGRKGHGAVLQITYYESGTACQRNRMCRVQFRNGRAVWSMAGLRRAPRVGNIGEGRTVNKGLEVRGDGGTVRETNSGQET
jgi:hypothetical protein